MSNNFYDEIQKHINEPVLCLLQVEEGYSNRSIIVRTGILKALKTDGIVIAEDVKVSDKFDRIKLKTEESEIKFNGDLYMMLSITSVEGKKIYSSDNDKRYKRHVKTII